MTRPGIKPQSPEPLASTLIARPIKGFAKKEELETQIQTIRIYNQDIRMEFSMEKYAILIMKSGKKESIELPNYESIKTLGEKENYKYLGKEEANTIKQR